MDKTQTIPVKLTVQEVQSVRSVNAKINGYLGGRTKSLKRAKASRRNGKIYGGAKQKQAA